MAVNISAQVIHDRALPARVEALLRRRDERLHRGDRWRLRPGRRPAKCLTQLTAGVVAVVVAAVVAAGNGPKRQPLLPLRRSSLKFPTLLL